MACEVCSKPKIYGRCPECEPERFVAALFDRECSPLQFIGPQYYGAWMRQEPLMVDTPRPRINGKWKAIVFRHHGHRCIHCGATELLQFGHVIPYVCGGNDQPGNGAPECPSCNVRQVAPLMAYLKRKAAA